MMAEFIDCQFCDKLYPIETDPETLKNHWRECPGHPSHELLFEIRIALARVQGLLIDLRRDDLTEDERLEYKATQNLITRTVNQIPNV